MTIAYILCIALKNGSMVDFCWPLSFTIMAIQFLLTGRGLVLRKLICIPYIICGLRFMSGWLFCRKHYKHEDRRWNLWRAKWAKGEDLLGLGLRGEKLNFLIFYQAQSLTNAFLVSTPLMLMCENTSQVNCLELAGLAVWTISFSLENVADLQLASFKRINRGNLNSVLDKGLWRLSRHPNYFFEWMLWVSYAVMAVSSAGSLWEYAFLGILILVTYCFLVYFTGVPMLEKGSLLRRGEAYRKYQESTNMFFPWLPKRD